MATETSNLLRIFWTSLFVGLLMISCRDTAHKQGQTPGTLASQKDTLINQDSIVYETDDLIIRKLSNHVYEHTSYLKTKDFGKVDCNGMLVINQDEAIIFDTPADDKSSEDLINYIKKRDCKIKALIPTHFHDDCVGGLETFKKYQIPCYASNQTIELLKKKGNQFNNTLNGFDDSITMHVGNKDVYALYFGEGHTKDNIIGYFPEDKVVFGGCLIKEVGAKKGNLEDANVAKWSETVSKLQQRYPQVQIIIPGHGKFGGTELYDYTINLFK